MRAFDSVGRWSNRVEDYRRYRPRYPDGVRDLFGAEGLGPGGFAADVGAGTGLLTELVLATGCDVIAIEPNDEMRAAADQSLGDRPGYRSIRGTAEATGLDDGSVDAVTIAQAFHWFDLDVTRVELARILRPAGWVAIVYNDRSADTDPFMAAYEQLLETYGEDYARSTYRGRQIPERIDAFFGGQFDLHTFDNAQSLDEAGLIGRMFSSSYTPSKDHPGYAAAREGAERLFAAHAKGGQVTLRYETRVFVGRLSRER